LPYRLDAKICETPAAVDQQNIRRKFAMICSARPLAAFCRIPLAASAIFVMAAFSPAQAQHIAVIVNGDPITTMDIANRSKLLQLTTHKTPSRKEVVDELIDEKLKIYFAKRYRLEASDSDVDRTFGDMARRMRNTPEGLSKILLAQGVDPYTLKDRIRAEIVWQQIVRGKYQASMQITDKEVANALETRKKDEKAASGHEYVLRPILFIVARNSGEGAVEARKRDAVALKARFENCETGFPMARALRDTVVRPEVSKSSADLAPALRDILDKTPVGKLTDPEVTQLGVEIFALCERKDISLEDAAKKQIQNEKFSEQFQANSAKLLKSVRASAMIEYKEPQKEQTDEPRPRRQHR
jgi:peptidyl-prolyl cis-trans isomerase SurA